MIMFDRITELTFNLGIQYVQWLSESPMDGFNLTHLSLIFAFGWLTLLFLWFIGQALQDFGKSQIAIYY